MKDWQKGYDIDLLKRLSKVFQQELKPFTFGAFGLPKENIVADALHKDQFAYMSEKSGAISAACIFMVAKAQTQHEDFSQTQFATVKKGDLFIRSIAGELKREIIEKLIVKSKAFTQWIEVHEENTPAVAVIRDMGFQKVLTKISASSDIKGLYVRGVRDGRISGCLAPEDLPGLQTISPEILSQSGLRSILSDLEEYEKTKPWEQHYSPYNKRQSWTAFAIRGYDPSDPGFIIKPSEMSKKWKQDNPARMLAECAPTRAAKAFPSIDYLFQNLKLHKTQRVRLMRLANGGGELSRHADITDPEAGTAEGKILRLHIPLKTHKFCTFKSWNLDGSLTEKHLHERGLFYLDTRKPHSVVNKSPEERIHLVIDAFSTPELREALRG